METNGKRWGLLITGARTLYITIERKQKLHKNFITRDSVAIARISHGNSVRPSVCLSVRHTGGSVKNG